MGELRVLNQSGDIQLTWDPDDAKSVKQAQDEWKRLKEDGYEFYEVVASKGQRVQRFSKKLGRVIAAPGVKTAVDKKEGRRPRAMAGGPLTRRVGAR